jgi:ferredoxin
MMAITRVWIEEGCIACGNSQENCPELLSIDYELGVATVIEGVDLGPIEDKIREAALLCPVDVIKYEES